MDQNSQFDVSVPSRFVDRDMHMRYFGGGIGHVSYSYSNMSPVFGDTIHEEPQVMTGIHGESHDTSPDHSQ
jgi:hypothetical protein